MDRDDPLVREPVGRALTLPGRSLVKPPKLVLSRSTSHTSTGARRPIMLTRGKIMLSRYTRLNAANFAGRALFRSQSSSVHFLLREAAGALTDFASTEFN